MGRSCDGRILKAAMAAATALVAGKADTEALPARSLFEFIPLAQHAAIIAGTTTYDATADIATALAAAKNLTIPSGTYIASQIAIPSTLISFSGLGKKGATIKHKTGSTGALWVWGGARVLYVSFTGINLQGHSGVGETCGFDLTGFSYCSFYDCRARLFKQDGWFTDGAIIPTNKQMSNNTFVNCTGNNNLRDGIRMTGTDPLRYENTANVFTGCEFAGNTGMGVNAEVCEASQWIASTAQNNTGRDFYCNSKAVFTGYVEGNAKPVELGPLSYGCEVRIRSTYQLWNTFIDNGTANVCSVLGEIEPERHAFKNPYFADWTGAVPAQIARNGSPVLASYADAESPFDAGLQVTVGANFQGLIFSVLGVDAQLLGRWATLLLDMDTSGVVDPIASRMYARIGGTQDISNAAFVNTPLPITAAGVFGKFAYDVRFPPVATGAADIVWYIAYAGISAGGNILKIRSARIVMGQTRKASAFAGDQAAAISATTTVLADAANGVNIHRKKLGKLVFDTTDGKMRAAVGTTPKSNWRAVDGSGDVTPG